jgi:hypothetical protein
MKKTFAKGFKSLIAVFVLVASLFLTANRAEAQSLNGSSSTQSINWKTDVAAKDAAIEQVLFWNQQGPYAPNTSQANNQVRHQYFYKSVYRLIEEGKTVPAAVDAALAMLTLDTQPASTVATKQIVEAMRQEAIEILAD